MLDVETLTVTRTHAWDGGREGGVGPSRVGQCAGRETVTGNHAVEIGGGDNGMG